MKPHPSARPGSQPRSPTPARRGRWSIVLGAALLLAGVAGSWWWLQRGTPAVPPMPRDILDPEVLQAVTRARQQVLDQPNEADAWGRLGMTLLAHDFLSEADQCFAEAVRLAPRTPKWYYGRAYVARRRGQSDSALPFLQQAFAAGQSRPEYQDAVHFQLAEAYLERQQLEEAEPLFRAELSRTSTNGPTRARAALGLGRIAWARNDEQTAKQFLEIARDSPSARKLATAQLAVVARARGELGAAASYDREVAALRDDVPWPDSFREELGHLQVGHYAWLQQEDQLEQQHLFTEAKDVYLRELQDRPTARAYAGAGFDLAQSGDFEQGLKYLREAVQLSPDNAHAHYLLACTLYVRAEHEWKKSKDSPLARDGFRETVQHAQRTVELRPTQAAAYFFWGMAHQHLGESAAAVAVLRQGVECAPGEFQLQLALGEVLVDLEQWQEAETYLKHAQKLNPKDPRPEQALERLRIKKGG